MPWEPLKADKKHFQCLLFGKEMWYKSVNIQKDGKFVFQFSWSSNNSLYPTIPPHHHCKKNLNLESVSEDRKCYVKSFNCMANNQLCKADAKNWCFEDYFIEFPLLMGASLLTPS